MNSLTIDPGIFALPPENGNIDIEKKNIQRLISNWLCVTELENDYSMTVSYIPWTQDILENSGFFHHYELMRRVKKLKEKGFSIDGAQFVIDDIMNKLVKNQSDDSPDGDIPAIERGKRGIYKEINPINNEYKKVNYIGWKYPEEFKGNLSNNFSKYLGFIADLNNKYFSVDNNYIVINGESPKLPLEVNMQFNDNKKSYVNIIGIQNAIKLSKEIKNSVEDALNETYEKNSKYIDFGKQISINNIKENMGYERRDILDKYKADKITESNYATRLYHYLRTLNETVMIINKYYNNDENNIVYLLNSHGCLCSVDEEKYRKCSCSKRSFKNREGKIIFFNLHLKPLTFQKNSLYGVLTRRIYFTWINKRITVGWIGKHPEYCSECKSEHECSRIKHENL